MKIKLVLEITTQLPDMSLREALAKLQASVQIESGDPEIKLLGAKMEKCVEVE